MQFVTNFKDWFIKAGIRAIKTIAQAAISVISTSYVLTDVNWGVVISASVLAGIISMLMSVAGLPELDKVNADEIDRSDENETDII